MILRMAITTIEQSPPPKVVILDLAIMVHIVKVSANPLGGT